MIRKRGTCWLFISLVLCVLLGYTGMATGLLDRILVTRRRSALLQQVDAARDERPPDLEFLTQALSDPDWFVAAVAAEHIRLLQQSQQLTEDQEVMAIQSLLEALSSGGHWWRFGWDRDEAQFEQFRGAAITTVSTFGPKALDGLLTATNSESPYQRKATCWIVLDMVSSGTVRKERLVERRILDRVYALAQNDRDADVRQVCSYVYDVAKDE